MELFDTHCHLNHLDFDHDREEARQRACEAGVTRLLCIGFDLASSRSAIEFSAWKEMRAAIGIHPESAGEWSLETASILRQLYDTGKAAAYGEIGLDYHWDSVPRVRQSEVFLEQIAFASTLSPTLPLIIHTRDALADTLAVLEASATKAPIVMHCFTGDVKDAAACLDAGCYLGIGGVATFKKSENLRAAITYAPLNRLLLETDCPYLAPQYKRGRRNEPSYLPAIVEIVAVSKGLSVQEIAEATTETARGLFGF